MTLHNTTYDILSLSFNVQALFSVSILKELKMSWNHALYHINVIALLFSSFQIYLICDIIHFFPVKILQFSCFEFLA